MNEYQIGQDIQTLRTRLDALERKCGLRSSPLKEYELSEIQKRNLALLRQHSREIVSKMNNSLSDRGINLYVASLTLLSDKEQAESMLYTKAGPCCCETGEYVFICDTCGIVFI
jgi:hypothetical protein